MHSLEMRSPVSLDKRQLSPDCFTTCLTNAMLSGKCMNSFSPDFSCMCSDSSFKSDTDSCLKSTCDGSAKLQDAQTTWGYFCVYVNSGAYTGLPTATGLGINLPTSFFSRTTASSASPTSSSSNGNGHNGNGNNSNSNGGNNNTGGTSKESKVPLGAIIGGAVGGVALILIIVFMILYFRRKQKPAQNLNEKYPQGPPPNPAFQQQFVPPQPPMAHMNMGPSPVINPSMTGGASPNPSFNSATPFMNQASGYAPSANSFVSGQASFNNLQPVASYPTQASHLPPGAGMGGPMSSQGQIYPENTGSTNIASPFLSPTSANSHSFNSHPSMPPTSPSSSSIPTTSDTSRLTTISTNSQQHLLGMTTYSSPNSSVPSPPSTGSSPSQQSAAQLNEKQRLQIHLEYQDGAATTASGSSVAGGSAGLPQSGFHVTNSHQQDGLDGRSVIYTSTTTSGVGSKGGAYNVTNPTSGGADAPPVYSERS